MNTTIVVLISRKEFLPELFQSLADLKCDVSHTALLCIVNGEADIYVEARNLCEASKYGERLCMQVKPKTKLRQYDIAGRRHRISQLHNIAKKQVNTEYVFGIEDDTIVPPNALERLGEQMINGVGMIEGVEMGRWGVPYIGAWRADDVNDPKEIISIPKENGTVEVDGCGFYCFITRAEYYKAHEFKPFQGNSLGPDIDFSLALRQQGLKNYADFSIECVHKAKDHDVTFENTSPRQIKMFIKSGQWRQNILY